MQGANEAAWKDRELTLRERELEIRRRAAELPVQLATLGLRGTMVGSIAGLVLVLALALISTASNRINITGTHLCIITGLICTTVVVYGAFVFQRSAQIAALWKDKGVSRSNSSELDTVHNQFLIEDTMQQHIKQYHEPLEKTLRQIIQEELDHIRR